ncbi:MAG: DUF134 domain-containing protein [Gemmatimonadales bacterium]|nr:MAG: DUF134 domain-containing protein [Gemmatimonadales bacterium]
MSRPHCCRRISGKPAASLFKPAGIPARKLDAIVMTLDEFEALRLADFEGQYQEPAAERMSVSRSTFGRILDSAHRKVAEVLIEGKALRIEGGPVHTEPQGRFRCRRCALQREGVVREAGECPRCHTLDECPESVDAEPDINGPGGRRRRMGQAKARSGRPVRLPEEKPR